MTRAGWSRAARGGPGIALVAALASACASGPVEPAALDTRNETCASCRMSISDPRVAAQVAAPGEVERFFDDIGCLATFVKAGRAPAGAVAFVADHRTKAWVRAERAVYVRVPGLNTPMGSHLLAFESADSRDRDETARGGAAVAPADIFGPGGPPGGGDR